MLAKMAENGQKPKRNTTQKNRKWIEFEHECYYYLYPLFFSAWCCCCVLIPVVSCLCWIVDGSTLIYPMHIPHTYYSYIYINVIREVWSSIWYFVSYKIIAWTRFGMTTHLHNRNWHLLNESVSLTETCFNREWFWLCVVNSTNIYFYHWINPKINPSTLQCIGTQILLNTQANWD